MPNPPRLHRRWGTERPRFLDEKSRLKGLCTDTIDWGSHRGAAFDLVGIIARAHWWELTVDARQHLWPGSSR
jgi:hypothetical protein